MANNKHVDLRKRENSGKAFFKKHRKIECSWEKIEGFGLNKATLFFLIEDKF